MKSTGIDTGKEEIHVCSADERSPREWDVVVIKMSDPTWRSQLTPYVTPPCIVAIESTGYHYSAPLFRLAADLGAAPYEVHNPVTARIRAVHISPTKNDSTDARALALIASMINTGKTPHGVHPRTQAAIELRMLLNERANLQKILIRTSNRAETIAYSLDPAYGHHKTALQHLITYDILLPQEAGNADLSTLHGATRNTIKKLLAALPKHIKHSATTRSLKRSAALYRLVSQHIDECDRQIQACLETMPEAREIVELWITIPGVSVWAAIACLIPCNLNPLSMTRDQFKRSVGAAPDSARSGATKRSKKTGGYKPAKVGLHLAALAHLSTKGNSPIKQYYASRDHAKLFAVKRKIASAMYGMAKTRTIWRESNESE